MDICPKSPPLNKSAHTSNHTALSMQYLRAYNSSSYKEAKVILSGILKISTIFFTLNFEIYNIPYVCIIRFLGRIIEL